MFTIWHCVPESLDPFDLLSYCLCLLQLMTWLWTSLHGNLILLKLKSPGLTVKVISQIQAIMNSNHNSNFWLPLLNMQIIICGVFLMFLNQLDKLDILFFVAVIIIFIIVIIWFFFSGFKKWKEQTRRHFCKEKQKEERKKEKGS